MFGLGFFSVLLCFVKLEFKSHDLENVSGRKSKLRKRVELASFAMAFFHCFGGLILLKLSIWH